MPENRTRTQMKPSSTLLSDISLAPQNIIELRIVGDLQVVNLFHIENRTDGLIASG